MCAEMADQADLCPKKYIAVGTEDVRGRARFGGGVLSVFLSLRFLLLSSVQYTSLGKLKVVNGLGSNCVQKMV